MRIVMECGRMVTGPYGWLITKVLHRKETYKTFIGLDSSMANLMRPGPVRRLSPHHGSGKRRCPANLTADITGSLCENNDKFAIDRKVPEVEIETSWPSTIPEPTVTPWALTTMQNFDPQNCF